MGRGCTMDEWVHFEKLPESGRVPNSSYWYVQCRHCAAGFAQKQLVNPPAKLTGRRTSMKAHLKACPVYAVRYKAEQAAAALKAAAQQQEALAGDAAVVSDAADAIVVEDAADKTPVAAEAPVAADGAAAAAAVGEEVTSNNNKRKRKIDADEVIGPRKSVAVLPSVLMAGSC